jgi:hypothetical protein
MKVSPLREYVGGSLYLPRATRFWRILLRKRVGVKIAKMRVRHFIEDLNGTIKR